MRRVVVCALMFFLLAVSAFAAVKFKQGALTITQDARRAALQVEVADTPETRSQGLMFRKRLAENAGMLFIFEEQSLWSFWMKNTLIPLSIAYIDTAWKIVDIKDMKVAPDPNVGPFEFYASRKPFKYALEVNQGYFKRKGIAIGARVQFEFKSSRR
ncbi:MAG: DUF192 domain-containing protein [Armatimonadetes bacterium]|nr:DUF192 domain-containing protein [Armatimonadota bacterium]